MNAFRTKTSTLHITFLSTAFLLTACGTPAGNAENGHILFTMHNCHGCHGKNANDGRAPKITALNRGLGSFVRFLRSPDSISMPSFTEEKISQQDAADIYTWLRSLPE